MCWSEILWEQVRELYGFDELGSLKWFNFFLLGVTTMDLEDEGPKRRRQGDSELYITLFEILSYFF